MALESVSKHIRKIENLMQFHRAEARGVAYRADEQHRFSELSSIKLHWRALTHTLPSDYETTLVTDSILFRSGVLGQAIDFVGVS